MRPLSHELVVAKTGEKDSAVYEANLEQLRKENHSKCVFNPHQQLLFPGLQLSFDDSGVLHGEFVGSESHQGYDGMMHGGLVAAIIDASMAQCLMGHGVVGYTAELVVKYRKPVKMHTVTKLATTVTEVSLGIVHSLTCEVSQNGTLLVKGAGKFFKVK